MNWIILIFIILFLLFLINFILSGKFIIDLENEIYFIPLKIFNIGGGNNYSFKKKIIHNGGLDDFQINNRFRI